MFRNAMYLVCFLSIISIGCSKDDETTNTPSTTLTGKIRGKDFIFGGTRYGLISPDQYRVIVFSKGPSLVKPCDSNLDDVYIDFKPKKVTTRVELNTTGISTGPNTVSFHHPDFFQNLVVDRTGYYQITEEKDSTLTITMDIKFDANNYIKGSFVATKCF